MSLFTQQSNALDALIADWNANLAADADEQIELLHDLQQQESDVDLDVLSGLHEAAAPVQQSLQSFDAKLQPVTVQMNKFSAKAAEGRANPDTALYGASMVAKIDAAAAKLTELHTAFAPKRDALAAAFGALEKRMADARAKAEAAAREEAARAAAEAERVAAEKREAERVRAEQEAAAKAAADAKAAEEAKAAAARQAEEARVAKEAADARAAAERVAREQLLAERRATEAREAAERAQAAEAERKRQEEAASSKPLDERCREQLTAALAELKANTTPQEMTVALQTLLKFLTNIMNSPMEEKYRSIRLSNEIFQKRLGSKAGGLACLRAMGFAPFRTPEAVPAGSDLKPNEEYYKIEAKAELWPVLVAGKKALDEAMRANRLLDPLPAAVGAGAPAGAGAASPFGAFGGMFPPAGAGAAGGAAGANPLSNPMAMLSDPFVQSLMSSPNVMNLAMQAAQGGGQPTPEMQQGLMQELMSNPQLLSNMMQSPMVQQMMANPQHMAAMRQNMQQQAAASGLGASPFGASSPFAGMGGFPFGGMPPAGGVSPGAAAGTPPAAGAAAANPMAAWLNMMAGAGAAGAPAPAAAGPASPFNFFQSPPAAAPAANPPAAAAAPAPAVAATPAATPAPAASPAAPAAAPAEEEVDEDALLAEAIQMSMGGSGSQQQPEKKD